MSTNIKAVSTDLALEIMTASKSSPPNQSSRSFEEMRRTLVATFVINDYDNLRLTSWVNSRNSGKLFDNNFLDKAGSMTLQGMWQGHESLAKYALDIVTAGLGTPNAAAGAGELFLLLSSALITKPTKGDISFISGKNVKEMIELKAGGKIGSNVQYQDVNRRVLKVFENLGIDGLLPTISSKKNSGKKQFIPDNVSCQKLIEDLPIESRIMIWQAWWDSQNLGSCLPKLESYTWSEIMWEWIRSVINAEFRTGITAFLIIKCDGNFIVWRNADDAIKHYTSMNETPRFEFRAAQSNRPAFYVPR